MSRWRAERLSHLPAYLFVEIDRRKQAAIEAGRDIIDFGVGDPDRPTPAFIVDALREAAGVPANHRYASSVGLFDLRRAFAEFFNRRFGVALDPETEVLVLLGSKEGIGHLPLSVVDPGETVLVPEPGYPVYASGAVLAGASCHTMALYEANGWLPRLAEIPHDVRRKARLLWLNYPNNPTGAVAPLSFFEEAVALAGEHGILIAQDAAYSELYFDDPPPSILQIAGAKELAVEFHSLSKTFNMTGWRAAFAVGNRDVLGALATVKSNLDSGLFQAVQCAAVTALQGIDRPEVREQVQVYRRRRDLLVGGLREAGWSIKPPRATFYLWAKCPAGADSMHVATRLLEEANVVAIPGVGFGAAGEGYIRFALTVNEERTREATRRIKALTW